LGSFFAVCWLQDYSSGNMGSCDCDESSLSSALTLQEQREMLRSVFPGRSSDASQEYDDDDEGELTDHEFFG
jgi:homeobox-leucine zipper protein